MTTGMKIRYDRIPEIIEQRRPAIFLEIGVWHGERAYKMIEAARRHFKASEIQYFGFDFFEKMPIDLISEEVSRKAENPSCEMVREYLRDHIDAGVNVQLIVGNSTKTLPNTRLPPIDFAFIDGGHSYNTVKQDWLNVSTILSNNGTVVFDDYVNNMAVKKEGFGVNQLVNEIDRTKYDVEILAPVDWWPRPWGVLTNRLVKVTRV
jgi:hypothetical protein